MGDFLSRTGMGARFQIRDGLLASITGEEVEAEIRGFSHRMNGAELPAIDKDGKIRVVVADDHRGIRIGLSAVLAANPDLEVIGEAANGLEAVELARRLRPDVVLMDISMPGMDGVEATRQIRLQAPDVQVIGLSMYDEPDRMRELFEAGAGAYFIKGCATAEIVAEIRRQRDERPTPCRE